VKSRRLDDLGTRVWGGVSLVIGPTLPLGIEEGMIVGNLVKLSGEMRRIAGSQNRESEKTINLGLVGASWPLSILATGASDWWP
jgi:hypothetical protein